MAESQTQLSSCRHHGSAADPTSQGFVFGYFFSLFKKKLFF
jgi:hypothetical protein